MGVGMAALGTSGLRTYLSQGLKAQVLSLNAALWTKRQGMEVEAAGKASLGY